MRGVKISDIFSNISSDYEWIYMYNVSKLIYEKRCSHKPLLAVYVVIDNFIILAWKIVDPFQF